MKKLNLLLMVILVAGMYSLQGQERPFHVSFSVTDASCYNNGKIAYALTDPEGNVLEILPEGLSQVRAYYNTAGSEMQAFLFSPPDFHERIVRAGSLYRSGQSVADILIYLRGMNLQRAGKLVIQQALRLPQIGFVRHMQGFPDGLTTLLMLHQGLDQHNQVTAPIAAQQIIKLRLSLLRIVLPGCRDLRHLPDQLLDLLLAQNLSHFAHKLRVINRNINQRSVLVHRLQDIVLLSRSSKAHGFDLLNEADAAAAVMDLVVDLEHDPLLSPTQVLLPLLPNK